MSTCVLGPMGARMRLSHFRLTAVLVCAFAGAAAAQPASFMLDVAAPSTQDVTLTVKPNTTLPFKIIRSGGPVTGNVALDLSTFTNDQGPSQRLTISVAGASGPDSDHLEVPFTGSVLPVVLHVPELAAGGKYSGRLILSVPQAQPVVWRFILTSTNELRPATLVLDQNAVTLTAIRPWCIWWTKLCLKADVPTVTVHARDKSGNWPLDGVMARLEPGLKAPGPGFDPKRHIDATFNAKPQPDIFAAIGNERDVAPHGQATISLAFTQFDTGES
jgi:hypothetical protein